MITLPTTFRFEAGQFTPHDEELFYPMNEDEEDAYEETLSRWGFAEERKPQLHGGEVNGIGLAIRAANDMRRPGQEFGFLVRVALAGSYQHVLCRTLPDVLALYHVLTPMLQLQAAEWNQHQEMRKLCKPAER